MAAIDRMLHGSTTCMFDRDTAGYWFPAGYKKGTLLAPKFSKTYYFGASHTVLERIPRGLQFLAGNPQAASAVDNPHVSWSCGAKGQRRTPIVDHPYDCTRLAERWSFVDSVVGRVALRLALLT
jgi:hypothetical protein